MRRLLARLKRAITGPTREEIGLPPESALPPLRIDPPTPYKPGTEHARWGKEGL